MADEMQWDRVIMGIDPGTNVMGYGVIGIKGKRLSMIAAGVVTLSKFPDHYLKLRHIYDRTLALVTGYLPDELAIEAPFFRQECAVDAQARACTGRGYCSGSVA